MGMLRITLAALLLSPALARAQTALENGFAVDVPPTDAGVSRLYTLEVLSGMTELRAILTGGSGDADLFLYYEDDAEPTCSAEELGPEEECTVVNPLPGTWTLEVYGATAFGNGVQLVGVAAVELADNVPETPISGDSADVAWYFIEVPAGQGHLNVTTTGGGGNPNMNVGADLFSGPECSSGSGNTVDSCEIDQPAAGTWFVQITGTSPYSGVTLNAEYGPERPPNAGNVSSGALAPLTLGTLLLAGLGAALRRREAASR